MTDMKCEDEARTAFREVRRIALRANRQRATGAPVDWADVMEKIMMANRRYEARGSAAENGTADEKSRRWESLPGAIITVLVYKPLSNGCGDTVPSGVARAKESMEQLRLSGVPRTWIHVEAIGGGSILTYLDDNVTLHTENRERRLGWASASCIEQEARRVAAEHPELRDAVIKAHVDPSRGRALLVINGFESMVECSTFSRVSLGVQNAVKLSLLESVSRRMEDPCPVCPVSPHGLCIRCQDERDTEVR